MVMFLPEFGNRPRMLLAYADPAYASQCGRYFRQLGWEVLMVTSGVEARSLAYENCPDVVVLDVALLDESGWLTSAKISLEKSELQIILVADRDADIEGRLRMVGADDAVCRDEGADGLASAIFGSAVYSQAI